MVDDADPSNNFEASALYPADFFDGTDRWYIAEYAPSTGWQLNVNDFTGTLTGSSSPVRFILNGNSMTLVLPASELSSDDATYRVTVFRDDGSFGMDGGFWNGDLSTAVGEPLTAVPQE